MSNRKQPFHTKLLELLKTLGLSQAQLAKRAGIEASHFSRLARGERSWKREQLERVAVAAKMTLADLVRDTEAESVLSVLNAPPDWTEREQAFVAQLQEVQGKLAQAEGENRALREELKARPTVDQVEALQLALAEERRRSQGLQAERDGHAAKLTRSQELINALRVENTGLRQYGLELDKHARDGRDAATQNYKAAMYWKKEAESRGAMLGVGAGFAAITLFASMGSKRSKPSKRLKPSKR